MPYRCVVPTCKGNYKNGPRFHVFSFPKNKELSNVWIRTIKRYNFSPQSKYFLVSKDK